MPDTVKYVAHGGYVIDAEQSVFVSAAQVAELWKLELDVTLLDTDDLDRPVGDVLPEGVKHFYPDSTGEYRR